METKKIRYIFIDSVNEKVSEVFLNKGLEDVYQLLNCELVEAVRIDGTNSLYVDEEGMFKINNETKFFTYGSSAFLIGSAVVTAIDFEGETIDTAMSIQSVIEQVEFFNLEQIETMKYGQKSNS